MVAVRKQNGRTGFTMKRRLLSTENNLVNGLRVLPQRTALQLSTGCFRGAFQVVVAAGHVLKLAGAYG